MGLFSRRNPAMQTWGDVTPPLPMAWLQLDRNDINREKNPRPFYRNYLYLFPNMQGGTLPTGKFIPVPLPGQTNPDGFIMANARRLNPSKVKLAGGSSTQIGNIGLANAMGSGQAQLPPIHTSGGFANWGSEPGL